VSWALLETLVSRAKHKQDIASRNALGRVPYPCHAQDWQEPSGARRSPPTHVQGEAASGGLPPSAENNPPAPGPELLGAIPGIDLEVDREPHRPEPAQHPHYGSGAEESGNSGYRAALDDQEEDPHNGLLDPLQSLLCDVTEKLFENLRKQFEHASAYFYTVRRRKAGVQ
jgi:hypothetical protein